MTVFLMLTLSGIETLLDTSTLTTSIDTFGVKQTELWTNDDVVHTAIYLTFRYSLEAAVSDGASTNLNSSSEVGSMSTNTSRQPFSAFWKHSTLLQR